MRYISPKNNSSHGLLLRRGVCCGVICLNGVFGEM